MNIQINAANRLRASSIEGVSPAAIDAFLTMVAEYVVREEADVSDVFAMGLKDSILTKLYEAKATDLQEDKNLSKIRAADVEPLFKDKFKMSSRKMADQPSAHRIATTPKADKPYYKALAQALVTEPDPKLFISLTWKAKKTAGAISSIVLDSSRLSMRGVIADRDAKASKLTLDQIAAWLSAKEYGKYKPEKHKYTPPLYD